jgi:hypothetical protein
MWARRTIDRIVVAETVWPSFSSSIVFDMKAGGDWRVLFRPFVGIDARRCPRVARL